jgi:hypothetical protein
MARSASLWLLALILATPACLGPLDPDVGPLVHELCLDEDGDLDHDVSWSEDVVPLLTRSSGGCKSCHLPGGETPVGITIGGLDLSTYATLRAGGVVSGAEIVIPGQPCDSVLYQKLSAAPPFGSRMPLDGPAFFSPAELATVHDWIAEGASGDD